jgi:hypothetical protein
MKGPQLPSIKLTRQRKRGHPGEEGSRPLSDLFCCAPPPYSERRRNPPKDGGSPGSGGGARDKLAPCGIAVKRNLIPFLASIFGDASRVARLTTHGVSLSLHYDHGFVVVGTIKAAVRDRVPRVMGVRVAGGHVTFLTSSGYVEPSVEHQGVPSSPET